MAGTRRRGSFADGSSITRRQSARCFPVQGHPARSRARFTLNTGRKSRPVGTRMMADGNRRVLGRIWARALCRNPSRLTLRTRAEPGALIAVQKHLCGATVLRCSDHAARGQAGQLSRPITGRANAPLPVPFNVSSRNLLRIPFSPAALRQKFWRSLCRSVQGKWYGVYCKQP